MPTGKPAQIMDALFAHAALLSTVGPSLPVSMPEPGVTFDPPADGKYLVVAFLPNRPLWEGLRAGKLDQGLLQISTVWPKNQGLIAPAQVAAQVEAHFAKNLRLVSGATSVRINAQPYTGQPLPDGNRVSLPTTISWVA
jgi:hypothetical protein